MYIYKITNLINNKQYVGQSVKDINEHYYGSGILIKKAIKKYKKQNFKKDIIEICSSIDELNIKESYYISKFKTIQPHGYNIRSGGNNSFLSETTKNKISVSRKNKCVGPNNPNWKAASFTEDTKRKISKSVKLRYDTYPSYKKAISKTSKNRKHSEITKKIMSDKKSSNGNPRYIYFDKKLINKIIEDYKLLSMNKLSHKYKVAPQTIKRVLIDNNISIIKRTN